MDVYLQYRSVTELTFYNCSAVPQQETDRIHAIRRPLRGVPLFIFGITMILIYIMCLRVMAQAAIIRKQCYKIMFIVGIYEISMVIINDVIFGYSLTFGVAFCDAPDLFYIVGCYHMMSWTALSYFCLYLAFNRIIEILKLRRETIEFFFSPFRTFIGCLIGIIYSLYCMSFNTPVVYQNQSGTIVPNPLEVDIPPDFEVREGLLIRNNFGVVTVTCVLYGIFCILLYKKFKKLGITDGQNNLQHQIFIQSTLMCGFNFVCSASYATFFFFPDIILIPLISFYAYQYTSGLQAVIYLVCNQTILNGVKDYIYPVLRIKREVIEDMRTNRQEHTEYTQHNVISASDNQNRSV